MQQWYEKFFSYLFHTIMSEMLDLKMASGESSLFENSYVEYQEWQSSQPKASPAYCPKR